MKVKTTTITTKEYVVELESDDWLAVKIGNNKAFALKTDLPTQSLKILPISAGALVPEEAFRISYFELEDLLVSGSAEYMKIAFPMRLYDKVKERLKDLPIILPAKALEVVLNK